MQAMDISMLDEVAAKRNTENFPVASWLIPKELRKDILTLYIFARVADDIADHPELPTEVKLKQLRELQTLANPKSQKYTPSWLRLYKKLLEEGRLSGEYGNLLISAFLQDVTKSRYADWGELMHYCSRSAAPIGRAMLELFAEKKADLPAADALCSALQILNHIQDIQHDYVTLDRIYLPSEWFSNVEDLRLKKASPSVRQALNQALDEVDILLINAASLPHSISRLSLALETRYILALARRLAYKLRKKDPLKRHVQLGLADKICALWGMLWPIHIHHLSKKGVS